MEQSQLSRPAGCRSRGAGGEEPIFMERVFTFAKKMVPVVGLEPTRLFTAPGF